MKQELKSPRVLVQPIVNVIRKRTVTYDCITFGSYPQSTGKRDPIKWRVLKVVNNFALIHADKSLDVMAYDNAYKKFAGERLNPVKWNNCSLRDWLNKEFLVAAFTAKEQIAIATTKVTTRPNPDTGISGGDNAENKIFLLSYQDLTNPQYGFLTDHTMLDSARVRKETNYSARGGSERLTDHQLSSYLLRSPGDGPSSVMNVGDHGYIFIDGELADDETGSCICPALIINLNADVWEYAGELTFNDIYPDNSREKEGISEDCE